MMHPALLSGLLAVGAYLIGSVSWSRIVTRLATGGQDVSGLEYSLQDSSEVFTSDSVSATSVRMQLGARLGCLTSLLDMAKVGVPTVIVRFLLPEHPYHLIVAGVGVIGHNWPVYHQFKGGRGASTIMGGMMAADPLGLVISMAAGSLSGVILGHILVFRWMWLVNLMIWMAIRHDSIYFLLYAAICNLAYWIAMVPEIRQYSGMRSHLTQEELCSFFGMGTGLGRFMDRWGLIALARRLFTRPL